MTLIEEYAKDPNSIIPGPTVASIGGLPWTPVSQPIWSQPRWRERFAQDMANRLEKSGIEYDAIVGLMTRGTAFATSVGLAANKPIGIMRKKPKGEGKSSKLIEGVLPKNARVVLCDDSFGNGTSSKKAVEMAKKEGLQPVAIAVIWDWCNPPDRKTTQNEFIKDGVQIISCCNQEEAGRAQVASGAVPTDLAPLVLDYSRNRSPWLEDPNRWHATLAAYRKRGVPISDSVINWLKETFPKESFEETEESIRA